MFTLISCKKSIDADIDVSTFSEIDALPIQENAATYYLLKSKITLNPNQRVTQYGFTYSYKSSVFDDIFNDSLKILYTFNGSANQTIFFEDTIYNMVLPVAYAVKPYAVNEGRVTLGKEITITPPTNSPQKVTSPSYLAGAINSFGLSNGAVAIVGGGKNNRLYTKLDGTTLTFSEPADTLPSDFANEFCTTFTLGSFGYVVGGSINGVASNQVYRYDFANNTWLKMQNFPGGARVSAVAAVVGQNAFVGFGSSVGSLPADWWQYDETNDSWLSLTGLPAEITGRLSANCFAIGNNIYLIGGNKNSNVNVPIVSNNFWQFNTETKLWKILPDCPFKTYRSFGYNYKNEGYVGFGVIGDNNNIIVGYNEPNAKWYGYYDGAAGSLGTSNKAFAIELNGKVLVTNFENNELLRVK